MRSDTDNAMRAAQPAALQARQHCEGRLPVFISRLAELVDTDSGPDHRHGRDATARRLADWAREAGLAVETIDDPAGLFVHATLAGTVPGRVVLLGHHDTVFSLGTAAQRPLAIHDQKAFGPGAADMKGGLLVALAAVEALLAGDAPRPTIEFHSVPDEEVRKVPFATMDRVRGADAVLVFECGRANGGIVAVRKTGAWIRLAAHGRSAHAGTEPDQGRNAALGLCREALRCAALHRRRPGLTVTLGSLAAGTLPNVVPAEAEAVFDVRADREDDLRWALAELAAFGERDGLLMDLTTVARWPGIEPTPAGDRLVHAAVEISAALGARVSGQTTGGMSDGCWTAAAGIPTLDGLGPVGGDDHSPDEYIDLTTAASRCGLAAGLAVAIGHGLLAGV